MAGPHFLTPLLSRDAGSWCLARRNHDTPFAETVNIAGDSAARKRGLLEHDHLPHSTAMVIAPCSAIHTFGMKFSIDVIFAARDGKVLKIARDIPPGRLATAWRAFAAIEMASGEAERHGVEVGDYVTAVRRPS